MIVLFVKYYSQSFLTHLFAFVSRGEAVPGSQLLMNDMPTRLQQEVTYEEMSEIIMKVLSYQ